MKKRSFIVSTLIMAYLVTGAAFCWAADKPIKWRFAGNVVPGRDEHKDLELWAKRIGEKSNGRLEITVYPHGALGFKPTDHLRVLKAGSVEGASLYSQYLVRDEPAFGSMLVQGIITDLNDLVKIHKPLFEIEKKILKKWDIVWAGEQRASPSWLGVYASEPIRTLEGLRGKKMRVWAKDQVEVFNRLGVSAQIIPQAELYLALKTKVIDCSIYAPAAVKSISLQEVSKYASMIYLYSSPFSSYGVSQKAWSKLPDDLKKIILEVSDRMFKECREKYLSESYLKANNKFFEDHGGKILEKFPIDDRKKVQETAFKVWEEMSKQSGPMAVENYKILKAALEQ